ncbi:MAG: hypothetical protein E6I59_02745 [Chloroflexi bacterium]|nr:MAG: hypothetical protein E6J36_18740 [Chloroflexota bacterium]TMC41900.1 MAG: hypothetical protein E6J31_05105 [Chloroflexota bacterium]TMD48685.1 MAG: hypothetical protein E6I90_03060 [Chloroflexota bacterium]TMD77885.1 MAG: hypothetical protein E6I97_08145 [Chloroflexota bacterium]TME66498.1 MAG: hypothetical protein E6I59_02745 [Chloroflexota bacterium]
MPSGQPCPYSVGAYKDISALR